MENESSEQALLPTDFWDKLRDSGLDDYTIERMQAINDEDYDKNYAKVIRKILQLRRCPVRMIHVEYGDYEGLLGEAMDSFSVHGKIVELEDGSGYMTLSYH